MFQNRICVLTAVAFYRGSEPRHRFPFGVQPDRNHIDPRALRGSLRFQFAIDLKDGPLHAERRDHAGTHPKPTLPAPRATALALPQVEPQSRLEYRT